MLFKTLEKNMEKQCAGFEPICIYCASENVHDCESKRDRNLIVYAV